MNPTDGAVSRMPGAAAHGTSTRPACGYLHNAFGPGCPYCGPSKRAASQTARCATTTQKASTTS